MKKTLFSVLAALALCLAALTASQCVRVDGHLGDELLPVFRQLLAPQHGQIGLGRGI